MPYPVAQRGAAAHYPSARGRQKAALKLGSARATLVLARRALVRNGDAEVSRLRGRCGTAALDYGDLRVAGRLVEIPLCQAHSARFET